MRTTAAIVTDDDIDRVHGRANFGAMTKRGVVDQGVLTYAFGYMSGHTQLSILREHGLITKPNGYKARLSKKGLAYLRAMFNGVPLETIMHLRVISDGS